MDESFVLEASLQNTNCKEKNTHRYCICNWNPAKCFLSSFYLFINIHILYYKALGPSRGLKEIHGPHSGRTLTTIAPLITLFSQYQAPPACMGAHPTSKRDPVDSFLRNPGMRWTVAFSLPTTICSAVCDS